MEMQMMVFEYLRAADECLQTANAAVRQEWPFLQLCVCCHGVGAHVNQPMTNRVDLITVKVCDLCEGKGLEITVDYVLPQGYTKEAN